MATKFPKKKSSKAVARGSKVRVLKKSSGATGFGRIGRVVGRKKSSGARTKQTARKSTGGR